MSEIDPAIRIPEHHLLVDLTGATAPARARVLKSARVAGGVVMNEDPQLLLDSAPPDPRAALRYRLEAELHMRAPFTFFIVGEKRPWSYLRELDPGYKRTLIDRVAPKGFKPAGVTGSLNNLQYLHDNLMVGRLRTMRNVMGLDAHSCEGYGAITFEHPEEITAERLRNICDGLGEIGANTTLAILVEASTDAMLTQ